MNPDRSNEKKQPAPIRLDDLLPRQNVKGGQGKPRFVFGSMDAANPRRRPGKEL